MKKSIKYSLFILVAVIMFGFTTSGILLNIFILEKYYIYKNKAIFEKVASEAKLILESGKDIQNYIETIDRGDGISVIITNENMQNLYSSFPQKKDNNRLPKEIEELIINSDKNLKKVPIYSTIEKQDAIQPKLIYVFMTKSNKYIVLTKPMKGIKESASMANEFYIIAGIITLAFASIVVYRFADNVTRPIIEMSKITEDISELNFNNKLNINSKNELGMLANNINILSDKLEKSIEGLKSDIEFHRLLSRNMSHEFKTPIAIIKGYAEGILYGIADTKEISDKYLKTITIECDRMDDFVKEILMLSKLSAKNFIMEDTKNLNVLSLLIKVMESFKMLTDSLEINITVICNENIEVNANPELINIAIQNLISNAIKYCDDNKYIRVSVLEKEKIEISVFNSCSAIAENELEKIFNEFYKIDKSRSRENPGHGLGLSIVRTIASLHHGSVVAQNVKGGVDFILKIPKCF